MFGRIFSCFLFIWDNFFWSSFRWNYGGGRIRSQVAWIFRLGSFLLICSHFMHWHEPFEFAPSNYFRKSREKIENSNSKRLAGYNTTSRSCRLCLLEKFHIMFTPGVATLNRRRELFSSCRHRRKLTLGAGKPKPWSSQLVIFLFGTEHTWLSWFWPIWPIFVYAWWGETRNKL